MVESAAAHSTSPQLTICMCCVNGFAEEGWALLFILALFHPPAYHLPLIHPANHPLFFWCVFYQIFVCSPLILHAASALLPLPSGVLSGKHNSSWISLDWHSVKSTVTQTDHQCFYHTLIKVLLWLNYFSLSVFSLNIIHLQYSWNSHVYKHGSAEIIQMLSYIKKL